MNPFGATSNTKSNCCDVASLAPLRRWDSRPAAPLKPTSDFSPNVSPVAPNGFTVSDHASQVMAEGPGDAKSVSVKIHAAIAWTNEFKRVIRTIHRGCTGGCNPNQGEPAVGERSGSEVSGAEGHSAGKASAPPVSRPTPERIGFF